MDKLKYFTISLVFITTGLFSQKGSWIEFGLTGSVGGNIITNKNLWNDQRTVTTKISMCYGYGAKLAININQAHEILLNAELAKKSEDFEIKLNSLQYIKSIALNTIEISPLYRYHSDEGAYIEIGPQFSLINKVEETRDGITKNISGNFASNYFSGVLGFGSNFIQSGAITLTAGFRFCYTFTDIISDNGGNGNNISYPLNDLNFSKSYTDYAPTKVYVAQLHFEFNFDLGYFVRSNCKRQRVSFITF